MPGSRFQLTCHLSGMLKAPRAALADSSPIACRHDMLENDHFYGMRYYFKLVLS